ncbi:MAG: SurA N-terminal domain-containing protein [Spirochaetes bacterium]|nr:SurA N-terminal domain-containing protein [Spirochaetota bacterium]
MRREDLSLKNIVWYIIIGFFTLIIVISFGMPDFLSRIGGNENMVAIVNGETIDRLDYVRFRDNLARGFNVKDMNDKDAARFILNSLIESRLQIQRAGELGITVSDDRVRGYIKSIPMFKNSLGSFDNEQYKRYLDHYNFSKSDYFFYIKENLISNEFYVLVEAGVAVSPDEVAGESAIENSQVQVQYAYISNWNLRKLFRNDTAVSADEVAAEMKASGADGTQAMVKMEAKKLDALKGRVMAQIDNYSRQGKPFAEVARQFGGEVSLSPVFRIGDNLREPGKASKHLAELATDRVFLEDCLILESGKTSRAIPSMEGILIFTPVKKEVTFTEPDPENYARIHKKLLKDRMNAVYASMMGSFRQRARITVNPKFAEN